MSVEVNKKLAHRFIERFNENDIAGALELMTDDATWWIGGKPDQLPAAGLYNKEKIAKLLYNMSAQLPDGLKMTVKGLIAENDKIAVEAESYGELRNGRVYNQEYHFLIKVRGGRIAEIREYLDTQHVYETWFRQ